jgi:hypothetical protein
MQPAAFKSGGMAHTCVSAEVPPGPAAAGPCRLQQWRHVVYFDKFIYRWFFLAFYLGKWSFLPKILEKKRRSVCGKKEEIKSNHMKEAHHTTLSSLPIMASSTPYHIHCSSFSPS